MNKKLFRLVTAALMLFAVIVMFVLVDGSGTDGGSSDKTDSKIGENVSGAAPAADNSATSGDADTISKKPTPTYTCTPIPTVTPTSTPTPTATDTPTPTATDTPTPTDTPVPEEPDWGGDDYGGDNGGSDSGSGEDSGGSGDVSGGGSGSGNNSGGGSGSSAAGMLKDTALAMFDIHNGYRNDGGLASLSWSDSLYELACTRAVEVSYDFSHDGFRDCHGENLLMASWRFTPQEGMEMWKSSTGHYENIMTSGFTTGAIAVYEDPSTGDVYGVAVFKY